MFIYYITLELVTQNFLCLFQGINPRSSVLGAARELYHCWEKKKKAPILQSLLFSSSVGCKFLPLQNGIYSSKLVTWVSVEFLLFWPAGLFTTTFLIVWSFLVGLLGHCLVYFYFQYPGTWRTKEEARHEVFADIKPECDTASDPSLFTINSDHVQWFLQPHDYSQLVAELQEEMAMSEEWALNEEALSDAEAR